MSIIGGNLADIEQAAGRLDDSGRKAVDTGATTKSAADVLAASIDDAMSELVRRFGDIAAELNADITTSHQRLQATEWQGASREAAVGIKQELKAQVDTVLGTATDNLNVEKTNFLTRAQALVDHVEGEFRTVMGQVETEYVRLADAARTTAQNFEAADQTSGWVNRVRQGRQARWRIYPLSLIHI